ncbi:MAG TPA: cupin domain-containing protein [Candidatus Limnocylindrales bacterium]|nr:cupin domain-containing protein [Candidatus Limnocylindrales bacterium]
MGRKVVLRESLESDPSPLRAPPSWINTAVGTVNGVSVLHAGTGRLDGRWHRQTSDEFLLVVEGTLVVEFDEGPLSAEPGEAIMIVAGERHRAVVPDGCLLLSVEGVGMQRTEA